MPRFVLDPIPIYTRKVADKRKNHFSEGQHERGYTDAVLQTADVELRRTGLGEDQKKANQDCADMQKDSLPAKLPPESDPCAAPTEAPQVTGEWGKAVCASLREGSGRAPARRSRLALAALSVPGSGAARRRPVRTGSGKM